MRTRATESTKLLSVRSDSKISDPNFGRDPTGCSISLDPSSSSRPASPASDAVDTAMDPQIQARLDAMQARPAAAINIDAGTLAAALNAARTKDHSKYLDHIAEFRAEGPLRADDFIKNVEGTFTLKSTPEADKVPLIVPRLTCKALVAFEAFKNVVGDTNNHHTTTRFAELRQLLLSLLPNLLVERDALEKEYIALHQMLSAEKFVEKYSDIALGLLQTHAHAQSVSWFPSRSSTELQPRCFTLARSRCVCSFPLLQCAAVGK
eukprot:2918112-Rhodomonas_salina.1